MSVSTPTRLKRPRHEMPAFIREALMNRVLLDAFNRRPAYQQNDYIGWITRAKRKETKENRLNQMLDELFRGDRYMKMAYRPRSSAP